MAGAEDGVLMNTELLSLPVLGVRPLGEHQKILVVVLALAVAALAGVTFLHSASLTVSRSRWPQRDKR